MLQANLVLIGCPLQTEGLNTQMGGASVCDATNLKFFTFMNQTAVSLPHRLLHRCLYSCERSRMADALWVILMCLWLCDR